MKNIVLPPPTLKTWQTPFELDWLLTIYRAIAPKSVCEIGSADGGTLWCWTHNCEPGTKLVSVDWFHPYYPDNRPLYPQWAAEGQCEINVVAGDSRTQEVEDQVRRYAPFDWLFIDAGHGIFEVTNDWNRYGAMVNSGGVVVFHDITPNPGHGIEVNALWAELRQSHKHMEIIADWHEDKCGLGILFK